MVEIDAVETVIIHHIGVQATIGTVIDIFEKDAVQPLTRTMSRV
ncbi:hypothetical protein BISA_0073 [Bifidobacterium saguini DSM 23967]|uniref:Uncharacterized protein n=1 Tax=Bifidobacterium saguini DSM 23967 TaxID=1437607 RepID=A0A087DET8_9BIFI|nr:hypothetical protein [Bifidobacterium saguini]KFI94038.1 hypothetical protein BISA_0073 [Bifidobacterium saguini DSM 23967]